MLTDGELRAMQAAIGEAEAEVRRLEAVASSSGGMFSWLFPTEDQRAAQAARATLNAIIGVRNGVIESGDHEEALRVVENARHLAKPGMVADAIRRPPAIEAIRNPIDLVGWIFSKVKPLVTLVVVLVVLGVVAFFVSQVRALLPARR